jgi:hypothetical protein
MWLIAKQFAAPGSDWMLDAKEPDYFPVPALDPAYDFKVVVYCLRESRGRRRYRSGRWLAEKEELFQVSEIIRDALRQTGRQFSIFEPGAAEQSINEQLANRLEDAARSDRAVIGRWVARAEVNLPDDVLTLMRNALNQEYEIRTKARTTASLISETEKLRVGWDRFLQDAAKSQNAQYAVRLAEDPRNIADVLKQVLDDRRRGAENLLRLIDRIVEGQRSADILDLVVQSETVLRKTLEMMGIPVPPMEADALLGGPLEGEI